MRALFTLLVLLFAWPSPGMAQAQPQPTALEQELRSLAWQVGPGEGRIGDKATIRIPEGYAFLDAANTRRFLELMGNPPTDNHYTFVPKSLSWFAVFSFDASGYVKDDEKIDPDELLKTLKDSDGPANEERKQLHLEAIYTEGWEVTPHYDLETKRLEWGTRLRTASNESIVNYTSRLLGRSGVMSAILVSDPRTLSTDVQEFKVALQGFDYVAGEKYSEFKPGDKMAEYGLAALIVGGTAAAAAKSGLLKGLGKVLWVAIFGGFAAVWGGIKKLLGRKDQA